MQKIVETLDVSPLLKLSYKKMADVYMDNMPNSLYENYYELAKKTDISVESWEAFLDIKEIESWINSKVAKLTDSAARSALNKLATSNGLTSNEVSAIKELLAKSKLMQQNQTKKPTVILTYIPQRN